MICEYAQAQAVCEYICTEPIALSPSKGDIEKHNSRLALIIAIYSGGSSEAQRNCMSVISIPKNGAATCWSYCG